MDLNLNQLGDQLSEKLKETSNMTRAIACKILERVREFKENFSGWDTVSQWVPGTEAIAKKVYHRQPRSAVAAKTAAKTKKPTTKKSTTASKGRSKRKK